MIRALILVPAGFALLSCASTPKSSHGWWQSLDGTEAPVEDISLSCRGIRSGDELDRLSGCWAPGAPRLSPMDVTGLEQMRIELRECVLEDLPAPMTEGEDRAQCHQHLAEVLDRRLYQLGWLKAEVTPHEAPGAGASSSRVLLAVQLGQRYRIGELFVSGSCWGPRTIRWHGCPSSFTSRNSAASCPGWSHSCHEHRSG